jgi:hypothetical protein
VGEFTQDAYPPQDAVWSPSAPWAQQQSQGSWSQTTEDGSARDKGLSGAGPASEPLPLPHTFSAPAPTTDAWSGHIGYPYPYADHRSVSPSSLSTGSARRHASPPRTAPETSWIQAPAPAFTAPLPPAEQHYWGHQQPQQHRPQLQHPGAVDSTLSSSQHWPMAAPSAAIASRGHWRLAHGYQGPGVEGQRYQGPGYQGLGYQGCEPIGDPVGPPLHPGDLVSARASHEVAAPWHTIARSDSPSPPDPSQPGAAVLDVARLQGWLESRHRDSRSQDVLRGTSPEPEARAVLPTPDGPPPHVPQTSLRESMDDGNIAPRPSPYSGLHPDLLSRLQAALAEVHALKQQLAQVDDQQREVQALRQQLEEVGDQQQELRELRQQLADGASRLHQEQASHAQQLHQEQASHAQQLQQERASHQQQLAECEAELQQARQAAIPARSTAEVGGWCAIFGEILVHMGELVSLSVACRACVAGGCVEGASCPRYGHGDTVGLHLRYCGHPSGSTLY